MATARSIIATPWDAIEGAPRPGPSPGLADDPTADVIRHDQKRAIRSGKSRRRRRSVAIGQDRSWWPDSGSWTRSDGRPNPGEARCCTFAYVDAGVPRHACPVGPYESPPPPAAMPGRVDRSGPDLGQLRRMRFTCDPGFPAPEVVLAQSRRYAILRERP